MHSEKAVGKIKIKQIESPMQSESKTEQTVDSEQPEQVIPNESVNVPDNMIREAALASKRKIFIRVWEFFIQNLGGIGTFLGGLAAFLAVMFKIILPNTIQIEGKFTNNEEISKLLKTEKSSEVEEFLQKVEQNPRRAPLIDKTIADAYRFQQSGEIEKAIKKWHSLANVVEGVNNNLAAAAWFSVGYLRRQQGEHERAISNFNKALNLKQDYVEAYYNRGVARLNIGKFKEAVDDFNKVLELNSDYVEAYYNRGFAYLNLDEYQDARANFKKALDLKQDYTEAKWGLQETELYLKSIKLIEPNAANAEAYYSRGVVRLNISKFKEAIDDFDKVLELDPDYTEAYHKRGAAKFSIELYQSAVADYNKVIRLNPEFPSVYTNRGEAKIKLKQYKSAITDCDKAIQMDPHDTYAYYIRADAKFYMGNIEEGKLDLKIALKLAEKAGDMILKTQIELTGLIDNLPE